MGRFALLLYLLISLACSSSNAGKETAFAANGPPQSAAPARIPVEVAEVVVENVPEVLRLTGTAQSWDEFSVNTEISGKVIAIHVEEGQFVEQGQLLLELDREKRLLEFRSRKARLERTRIDVEYARRMAARGRALLENGAISESEVDTLDQAVQVGEAEINLAQISIELIEEELKDTRIHSAVAGQVATRHVSLGASASPVTPLFTIIQTNPLKVVTEITESDLAPVRRRKTVEITFDALPRLKFTGDIHRIHPVANPRSGGFPVEISVLNEERTIQTGMLARLRLVARVFSNVLLVPLDAVVDIGGRNYVFAINDDTAHRLEVQIRRRFGDRGMVTSESLKAGDRVVVRGNRNLTEGTSVEVVP